LLISTRKPCKRKPPRGFGGGAQELHAEPNKISGAGEADPVEPPAQGLDERGEAGEHDPDHESEAELRAGDVQEPGPRAVPEAVRDDEGHGRPGHDDKDDAGCDIG